MAEDDAVKREYPKEAVAMQGLLAETEDNLKEVAENEASCCVGEGRLGCQKAAEAIEQKKAYVALGMREGNLMVEGG